MKAFREHFSVLAGYTLLTLLLTYPIIFQLSTHLPGDGGDSNIRVWNLWWIKKALVDLHTNPFWTDYVFYPEGVSLVFHNLGPFTGLLGAPLQALVGLPTANNLLILLSFVLSGYGAYLLTRYLVANRPSAFLGGIIFTFCPYKFAHLLGHFNLVFTEWIPFYVLTLLRLTSYPRREAIGPSLRCATCLLLIAFCDFSYLIHALMFTALFVAYRMRIDGCRTYWGRDGRKLAISLGFFLIGFAPVLLMAGIDLLGSGPAAAHGLSGGRSGGATAFQADLLSFITPSPLHPFLGPLVQPVASRFSGGPAEATVFAGYLPLVLGLIAATQLRLKEPWVRFWCLVLMVFFILSLGPFPRVLGIGINFIPLPYHLIMRTPILNHLRVPSRFDIMVMLSLAVLSAFSCRRLFDWFASRAHRSVIFLGITLTILFEYLAIPFPTFGASTPAIYEQIAKEPGQFTVLDIPLARTSGTGGIGKFPAPFMLYQTVHEKKIVGGQISRVPDATIQAFASRPLLRKILEVQGEKLPPDTAEDRPVRALLDDLAVLQVRYVIIHRRFTHSRIRDYVEATLPVEKISEENGVIAFRVIPQAEHARRAADVGRNPDRRQ